jgi:hypothetical protein
VSPVPMEEFFGGAARVLVAAQLELDERGRDTFDAFGDTGVPPTVFAYSGLRLTCPVAVGLRPKTRAEMPTRATLAPHGAGTLTLAFRYLLSPQGGDDPRPVT